MGKNEPNHGYYPLFLNVKGKSCVVVGGGKIAWRRVNTILEHGASVTVLSPSLCPELSQFLAEKKIKVIFKEFSPEDIRNASLVIAATDKSKINNRVASEARKQKILVNVVDNLGQSDFIVPASLCRGDLTVAISTAGKSPALARKLKDTLEKGFGSEYAAVVDLVAEVRYELKQGGVRVADDTWQKALDVEKLARLLREQQRERAKSVLVTSLTGQVNKYIR